MTLKIQSLKQKTKKLRVNSSRKRRGKSNVVQPELDYKGLYENSPTLGRTINRHGIIIACNNAYAKHFGYSKNEIIGKSIFKHIAKESHSEMRRTFNIWKKTGRVTNKEIWFKRKNKTIFLGILSANNIYDSKRRLVGSN